MDKLATYLESDRQWPRHLRMGHAVYQIKRSRAASDWTALKFWRAVYNANLQTATT